MTIKKLSEYATCVRELAELKIRSESGESLGEADLLRLPYLGGEIADFEKKYPTVRERVGKKVRI